MFLKKDILLCILICSVWTLSFNLVSAQQSSLFSHYYWNEQYYNPAYAGSKDMLHIRALNRFQWVGLEGTPQTFNAAVHSPLRNENIALGLNFYNDRIGAINKNGVIGQYAYRLKFKEDKYKLSLGVQTGFEYKGFKRSKLHSDDLSDVVESSKFEKEWSWILGAGAYFYGSNFSVGFGVPQILPNSLFKGNNGKLESELQYFISGAYQTNINEILRILPTATLRIMHREPIQFEMTASAILYDKFQIGLGGRSDKTLIFLGQYMHSFDKGIQRLNIGYSYDKNLGLISQTNKGSHEIFISFDLPQPKQDTKVYKSPRYF